MIKERDDMKLSSYIAIGGLLGGKIGRDWDKKDGGDGKLGIMDGIYAAILAKNELLDENGEIRGLLESKNDRDVRKMKKMLREKFIEEEPEEQISEELARSINESTEKTGKMGFWNATKLGFETSRIKRRRKEKLEQYGLD